VTDAHLAAALDQLLDASNQLTRVLLGGSGPAAARRTGRPARPGGADLTGQGDAG
jgi:hypothetical protein